MAPEIHPPLEAATEDYLVRAYKCEHLELRHQAAQGGRSPPTPEEAASNVVDDDVKEGSECRSLRAATHTFISE